jgi:hypothetical protein
MPCRTTHKFTQPHNQNAAIKQIKQSSPGRTKIELGGVVFQGVVEVEAFLCSRISY